MTASKSNFTKTRLSVFNWFCSVNVVYRKLVLPLTSCSILASICSFTTVTERKKEISVLFMHQSTESCGVLQRKQILLDTMKGGEEMNWRGMVWFQGGGGGRGVKEVSFR